MTLFRLIPLRYSLHFPNALLKPFTCLSFREEAIVYLTVALPTFTLSSQPHQVAFEGGCLHPTQACISEPSE